MNIKKAIKNGKNMLKVDAEERLGTVLKNNGWKQTPTKNPNQVRFVDLKTDDVLLFDRQMWFASYVILLNSLENKENITGLDEARVGLTDIAKDIAGNIKDTAKETMNPVDEATIESTPNILADMAKNAPDSVKETTKEATSSADGMTIEDTPSIVEDLSSNIGDVPSIVEDVPEIVDEASSGIFASIAETVPEVVGNVANAIGSLLDGLEL